MEPPLTPFSVSDLPIFKMITLVRLCEERGLNTFSKPYMVSTLTEWVDEQRKLEESKKSKNESKKEIEKWVHDDVFLVFSSKGVSNSEVLLIFNFEKCLVKPYDGGELRLMYNSIPHKLSSFHEQGKKLIIISHLSKDNDLEIKKKRLREFVSILSIPFQIILFKRHKNDAGINFESVWNVIVKHNATHTINVKDSSFVLRKRFHKAGMKFGKLGVFAPKDFFENSNLRNAYWCPHCESYHEHSDDQENEVEEKEDEKSETDDEWSTDSCSDFEESDVERMSDTEKDDCLDFTGVSSEKKSKRAEKRQLETGEDQSNEDNEDEFPEFEFKSVKTKDGEVKFEESPKKKKTAETVDGFAMDFYWVRPGDNKESKEDEKFVIPENPVFTFNENEKIMKGKTSFFRRFNSGGMNLKPSRPSKSKVMTGRKVITVTGKPRNVFVRYLHQAFSLEHFVTFSLEWDPTKFRSHIILSHQSPFLRDLVVQQKLNTEKKIVMIPKPPFKDIVISPRVIRLMFECVNGLAWSGKLVWEILGEKTLPQEIPILVAAKWFGLTEYLVYYSGLFPITSGNVFYLFRQSLKYELFDLRDRCSRLINQIMSLKLARTGFSKMSKEALLSFIYSNHSQYAVEKGRRVKKKKMEKKIPSELTEEFVISLFSGSFPEHRNFNVVCDDKIVKVNKDLFMSISTLPEWRGLFNEDYLDISLFRAGNEELMTNDSFFVENLREIIYFSRLGYVKSRRVSFIEQLCKRNVSLETVYVHILLFLKRIKAVRIYRRIVENGKIFRTIKTLPHIARSVGSQLLARNIRKLPKSSNGLELINSIAEKGAFGFPWKNFTIQDEMKSQSKLKLVNLLCGLMDLKNHPVQIVKKVATRKIDDKLEEVRMIIEEDEKIAEKKEEETILPEESSIIIPEFSDDRPDMVDKDIQTDWEIPSVPVAKEGEKSDWEPRVAIEVPARINGPVRNPFDMGPFGSQNTPRDTFDVGNYITISSSDYESDTSQESLSDVEEKDVDVVIEQVGKKVSRKLAIRALKKFDGDVVDAVIDLQDQDL